MTDAATIAAGLQSLKAAFDIGKALLNLGISAEVQDRIREMNERILAAQESAIASRDYQSALLKQIGELEKQIAEFEAWEAEAKTYELKEVPRIGDSRPSGLFAFAPREGTHPSEPPHLLCAQCYNDRHKSYLQKEDRIGRCVALACHRCGSDLYLAGEREPMHVQSQAVSRRKRPGS
jgi:hypothetical protein